MTKTKGTIKELEVIVLDIEECEECNDVQSIVGLLQERAETYVRVVGDHLVISPRRLSVKQAERAIDKDRTEYARELLKEGEDPYSAWCIASGVCVGTINRLLREEKIQADPDWFRKGEAEADARHAAAQKADLGALQAKVTEAAAKRKEADTTFYAAQSEYEFAKAHQSAKVN